MKKAKFRVGQRVAFKRSGKIVTILGRDTALPKLWLWCSDNYFHRSTDLRLLTAREIGPRPKRRRKVGR